MEIADGIQAWTNDEPVDMKKLIEIAKNPNQRFILGPALRKKLEDVNIKEFYTTEYSSDELGQDLKDNITFADLFDCLNKKNDVYDLFGVGDSIIRERMFGKLSNLLNWDYDVIYEMWLR